MARGPKFTSAELKSLPVLDVHIPPMPGSESSMSKRTHVVNVGQNPEKYTVAALKKKSAANSDRRDIFEKTLLALSLATGGQPIPYAFKTAGHDTIRSLDAGCLGYLMNRKPPLLEVTETDARGNIISVMPTPALRSRHQYLSDDNLRRRVATPTSETTAEISARVLEDMPEPLSVEVDAQEPLGFDPFAGFDERTKILSEKVRREGQNEFTKAMRRNWRGKCPVTQTTVLAVLDGAHIFRYGGVATNDHRNGLLLRADIHRLFDRYFVSFVYDGPDLIFQVARTLRSGEYGKYHELQILGKDIPKPAPHGEVVRYHNEEFQKKEVIRLAER